MEVHPPHYPPRKAHPATRPVFGYIAYDGKSWAEMAVFVPADGANADVEVVCQLSLRDVFSLSDFP